MNNEHEHDDDVQALRANIEETRHRISGEIEAIGDKLTPEHARDVARNKVMDARDRAKRRMIGTRDRAITRVQTSARSAADAASHATERLPEIVRANPIPTAMVTIGATWLTIDMISRFRHRKEGRPEQLALNLEGRSPEAYGYGGYGTERGTDYGTEYDSERYGTEPYGAKGYGEEGYGGERYGATEYGDEGYGGEPRYGAAERDAEYGDADRMGEEGKDLRGEVRERAAHARERASAATGRARERIGSAAHIAQERLRDTKNQLRERAGTYAEKGRHYADKGRHGVAEARDRSMDAYQRNPLMFGAVCMLTGVGLGMLLPHTRREDQALGEQRERLMGRAKHVAHDAKEAAVHSAREGLRVAKETAREDFESMKAD